MTTDLDALDLLRSNLQRRFDLDAAGIELDSRLSDLGLDSMHVLEIMMDMESALGIRLEDLAMPANPSLREVAAAIARNVDRSTAGS